MTMPEAPKHWRTVRVTFWLHDVECLAEVAFDLNDVEEEWLVVDCGTNEDGEIGAFIDPYKVWLGRLEFTDTKPSQHFMFEKAQRLSEIIEEEAAEHIQAEREALREQAKEDAAERRRDG